MSVKVKINGVDVQVEEGMSVLQAANKIGVPIPTLCYHPAVSNFGACRLCVVEIKGMKNLPASCVTEVRDGMEIYTESEEVIEARKTILELLLANHPYDCMTCDKSGDCKLQDYAYQYQIGEPSIKGETHNYPLDEDNPYIIRDNNKCILCGRCVRICAEVKKEDILGFVDRGFNTRIAPAFDKNFRYSDCVYCHNCVAICPVGALMDKEQMGKGRRWEIQKQKVNCQLCENACAYDLLKKNGQVVGISARPGKPEREGQPCLKGRLSVHLRYNPNIPDKPQIKKDGDFVSVSWAEAMGIEEIMKKIKEMEER